MVTRLWDYDNVSALYAQLERRLTIMSTRLRLLWGEETVPGWSDDHPEVSAIKLWNGQRKVSLTFVVMNVFPCQDCGEKAVVSGWCSCVTGLPDMHLPCKGCDQYWDYMEYGYRGLRLWKHFSRVLLCHINLVGGISNAIVPQPKPRFKPRLIVAQPKPRFRACVSPSKPAVAGADN